jgi:hypothetical protein
MVTVITLGDHQVISVIRVNLVNQVRYDEVMSAENSESHIIGLSELRNTWPGIEISGSPQAGAWEAVRRDGAAIHILVAMTLPSLAAKMRSAGWPRGS